MKNCNVINSFNGIEDCRKRMSIKDKSHDLLSYFNSNMNKLKKMWDELEMVEEMRVERTATFYATMKEVIDFMINEETNNYNEVFKDSANFLNEVNSIRAALGMEKYDVGSLHPNTIVYCKSLKNEIKFLEPKKEKLLQEQKEAFDAIEALSRRLLVPTEILYQRGSLLGPEKWKKLKDERSRLIKLFDKRMEEFVFLKEDIIRLKDSMKKLCTQQEIDILNIDIDRDDFICSENFLEKVRCLRLETQAQYDIWKKEKVFTCKETIIQLRFLYDKCFVPELKRLFPENFTPDFVDDDSMNIIQDEIKKYEAKYEASKELYDTFYNWSIAWDEHLQVEADFSNPSFYVNRAGHIQKVLTRQKDIEKRLKQYLQKLESLDDPKIKINGLTLYQKALNIVEDEKKQKELDKQFKLEQKKMNIKKEAIYGVKLCSQNLKQSF